MVEQPQCSILVCKKTARARGWCWAHYGRWRRHGDPYYADASWHLKPLPPPRPTEAQRFWVKVEFTDSCWLWTGASAGAGYGHFRNKKGLTEYCHRYAYEFCVGPIPKGLTLDHLCETKLCVRPEHLEPATSRVNTLRSSKAPAAINARKTHCKQGHKFTKENTRLFKHKNSAGRLWRQCRACGTVEQQRVYRQRRKQKEEAVA